MRIGGNHRALRLFMLKNDAKVRRSWNRHNKAAADKLTKTDIGYALRYGDLPEAFWRWMESSDSKFVHGDMERMWTSGMQAGGQSVTAGIRHAGKAWNADWQYTPTGQWAQGWIDARSGSLIREWGKQRRQGLRLIIEGALRGVSLASGEMPTAFYIGELIKAAFGLTQRQAGFVVSYADEVRKALIEGGISGRALEKQVAAKVKTYEYSLTQLRAQTIARTETAAAFNRGQLASIQEATDRGLLGDAAVMKVWSAASDCCSECQELDGTVIGLDESFGGHGAGGYSEGQGPPLHPNCRCTLVYETRE